MKVLKTFYYLSYHCEKPVCTHRSRNLLIATNKYYSPICVRKFLLPRVYYICNVQLKNLRIEQNTVWSKTTLITRGVGVAGPGVDPPTCKMDTFFLRSLAISIPIYRNFQSNGANCRSFKL